MSSTTTSALLGTTHEQRLFLLLRALHASTPPATFRGQEKMSKQQAPTSLPTAVVTNLQLQLVVAGRHARVVEEEAAAWADLCVAAAADRTAAGHAAAVRRAWTADLRWRFFRSSMAALVGDRNLTAEVLFASDDAAALFRHATHAHAIEADAPRLMDALARRIADAYMADRKRRLRRGGRAATVAHNSYLETDVGAPVLVCWSACARRPPPRALLACMHNAAVAWFEDFYAATPPDHRP